MLYLPLNYAGSASATTTITDEGAPKSHHTATLRVQSAVREEPIADDREKIEPGENVLLIVEDDPHYARILLGLARDHGFKGIVAQKGAMGLALARQFRPTAISLDIFLPDMLGWTVLHNLKLDPNTRHIPVQVVTQEEDRRHGLSHGAFSYVVKSPTTATLENAFGRLRDFSMKPAKRLLVVEDNDIERQSIVALLDHDDIQMKAVGTGTKRLRRSPKSRSIAWCSTSACPT